MAETKNPKTETKNSEEILQEVETSTKKTKSEKKLEIPKFSPTAKVVRIGDVYYNISDLIQEK